MDISILKNNDIDVDSGIEILGDIDIYNDILKEFLDTSSERLAKIEEYKNNNDMENYTVLVHAMKGDSKYLGFTKLAELSYQHEIESKANNFNYV